MVGITQQVPIGYKHMTLSTLGPKLIVNIILTFIYLLTYCLFKQYIGIKCVIVITNFIILITKYILWLLTAIHNFDYYHDIKNMM